MNRWDKENGEVTKWNRVVNACVALVIGMLLGVFNLYNLLEIMQQIYKAKGGFQIINEMLNRYPYVTVVVVVALGIVFKISVSVEDQTKYEFI